MDKELWLLRHGQAAAGGDDFNRPLTAAGHKAAHAVGAKLRQQHGLPDLVLSSPALRAIATATAVAMALAQDPGAIRQDARLYFQGVAALKAVLAELDPRHRRVLLVGHNPDLEALLQALVGAESLPGGGTLPTATLARLAMPENWCLLPDRCAGFKALVAGRDGAA